MVSLVPVVSEDASHLGRREDGVYTVDEVFAQVLAGVVEKFLVDVEMQRREEPGCVVRPFRLELAEQKLAGFGVLRRHCDRNQRLEAPE